MRSDTERAIRDLAMETAPRPRLVVLTGAGISAESGLRTYRGPDGLYSERDVQRLVTADALRRDPAAVIEHFQGWREQALTVQPNAAHLALERLEEVLGKAMTLVTQNVDTLHDRAGSRNVLAMHGDLATVRCDRRGHVQPWEGVLDPQRRCPVRSWSGKVCSAPLRPHVVLFGEPVLHTAAVERAVSRCTAFWAVGTSGTVMPAAGLVVQARLRGATTALFNLTPPGAESDAPAAMSAAQAYDHVVLGRATETVPRAVEMLIDEMGGP